MVRIDEKPITALADSPPRITSFSIHGGIFGTQTIPFPIAPASELEPSLLILSGRNGAGKTTILRMLDGMLTLNFDVFRKVPFEQARLALSDDRVLTVTKTGKSDFPIRVHFDGHKTELHKVRGGDSSYTEEHRRRIDGFRAHAGAILGQIDFELLDIHRSLALKTPIDHVEGRQVIIDANGHTRVVKPQEARGLSQRVRTFMSEAQVNYRKFFSAGELELLPRILERFRTTSKVPTPKELLSRVHAVQSKFPVMRRFGLQTDDADLKALVDVLSSGETNELALTLIEAYVEMQESRHKARELIATRLVEFERIMDEFLIGKEIRIDSRSGLRIGSKAGDIRETDLSSGEYHFLYMMVSALLCQRAGSILAIDEPELSLHVSWQRKVISALAKCAAGASPLFLFATHSPAISAEHLDKIHTLSPIE